MPLASTIKIVILAAYAIEVNEGQLDPTQAIPISDWEAYYLPGTDGGAHPLALKTQSIAQTPEGYAQDSTQTVPLQVIAQAMIEQSDNAATDYILNRIDPATLDRVLALPELDHQARPESILGTFLMLGNHEQAVVDQNSLSTLQALSSKEWQSQTAELAQRYSQTDWGQTERIWRAANLTLPSYAVQQAFFQSLMPQGTAGDYAAIMAGVQTGTFISPQVSALMRDALEWPMRMPGNSDYFSSFGAKGGSLPGILTEAMFITPEPSDWNGPTRVVVLFQNNLAANDWAGFLESFSHQNVEVQLGRSSEFANNVVSTFNQ